MPRYHETLKPHPDSRSAAIRAIEIDLTREPGRFRVRYRIRGAQDDVKRPPPKAPLRADGLWRTTCFEAFLATDDGGYYELNFSPSTEWAVYRFDGYRAGMRPSDDVGTPSIEMAADPARQELVASFGTRPNATRLGLSAIIEAMDGTKSYWALAHPEGQPDFHHPVSFALDLSEHR
jgi:hypothetical protein